MQVISGLCGLLSSELHLLGKHLLADLQSQSICYVLLGSQQEGFSDLLSPYLMSTSALIADYLESCGKATSVNNY